MQRGTRREQPPRVSCKTASGVVGGVVFGNGSRMPSAKAQPPGDDPERQRVRRPSAQGIVGDFYHRRPAPTRSMGRSARAVGGVQPSLIGPAGRAGPAGTSGGSGIRRCRWSVRSVRTGLRDPARQRATRGQYRSRQRLLHRHVDHAALRSEEGRRLGIADLTDAGVANLRTNNDGLVGTTIADLTRVTGANTSYYQSSGVLIANACRVDAAGDEIGV